jgi:hypothetical protein
MSDLPVDLVLNKPWLFATDSPSHLSVSQKMSKGMLRQTACLLLVLGAGYAKHYVQDPLATDCITNEVLWAINYHHDVSISDARLLEYDSVNNHIPVDKN